MGEKSEKTARRFDIFNLSKKTKITLGVAAVSSIAGVAGTGVAWSYVGGLKAQRTQAQQEADLGQTELRISEQLSRQGITDVGQPDASGEIPTIPVFYGTNDSCVSNLEVATAKDGTDTLYLNVPDGKTGTVGDITAFSNPTQQIAAKAVLFSISQTPGSTACHH